MTLPSPNRKLGWGLLVLSLGLHGAALLLPMRPLSTLQIPETELPPPEVIPVTRLPAVTLPEAAPPTVAPAPVPPPVQQQPVQPTAQAPAPSPAPQAPIVEENVVEQQEEPGPEAEIPEDGPDPEPPEEPPEEPPNVPPPLERGKVVPFADDFPHFADAQMGCYGLDSCGQLSNIGNYRRAVQLLIPELELNGYEVDEHVTDEPGYSVYKISRPDWRDGEPHYLSIFSDGLGQAVYVITLEVITLDELRQLV